MRLSEIRGVLFQLEQLAHKKGNIDPIVEFFKHDLYMEIDLQAIANDPEGQLLRSGTIHLPMVEIERWGYVVTFRTTRGEDCITIQAESKEQARRNFAQHFNYEILDVIEEF